MLRSSADTDFASGTAQTLSLGVATPSRDTMTPTTVVLNWLAELGH